MAKSSPSNNPDSRNANGFSWVMWSGGLVLDDPQRDGPDLARLLAEPPFTKVEVRASEGGTIIRASFPKGNRTLSFGAMRILLERVLEHTGADMRSGPWHPSNYRQDEFFGDLWWDEDNGEWRFGTGAGVSGTIRPPDPPKLTAPQLPLLARWWREIQGLFHRGELRRKQLQELSDRYRDMDIGPQLDIAKRIMATIDDFERTWKDGAADHLHALYNSNWSGGRFIDRAEFLSRIRFTEFRLDPDGRVEARFDDGDLFCMHTIVVEVDSGGNVTDATLEG